MFYLKKNCVSHLQEEKFWKVKPYCLENLYQHIGGTYILVYISALNMETVGFSKACLQSTKFDGIKITE
jgi:hypothetical protein